MNVSPISSNHQAAASSKSESREAPGKPDHDGDADDRSGGSGTGAVSGATTNGQGQTIGTLISAKA